MDKRLTPEQIKEKKRLYRKALRKKLKAKYSQKIERTVDFNGEKITKKKKKEIQELNRINKSLKKRLERIAYNERKLVGNPSQ